MEPFGEVVYTGTTEIVGQCRRGSQPPEHGSFIRIGKEIPWIGVVTNVETTSLDPNRRPIPLELPEEELPKAYPQLMELLRSQFQAQAIGRIIQQGFRFGLPGIPPSLHAQISVCHEEEIREISRDYGFMRLIYVPGKPTAEELLLNTCRIVIEAHGWKRIEAVRMGKAISELLRDDYDSLRRFMARLELCL